MLNSKFRDAGMVVAPLEGATEECLADALSGGVLRLDEGRVGAFAGPDRQLIGWVTSRQVLAHLEAGGLAYFRSSGDLDRCAMLCALFD